MRFTKAYRLVKIGFQPEIDDTVTFQVVGSPDCVAWTTLQTVHLAGFANDQFMEWTVASPLAFPCIGLRFPRNPPRNNYIWISRITLWAAY